MPDIDVDQFESIIYYIMRAQKKGQALNVDIKIVQIMKNILKSSEIL